MKKLVKLKQNEEQNAFENFKHELPIDQKQKADLLEIIDTVKPEIILGTETWLDPSTFLTNTFPQTYIMCIVMTGHHAPITKAMGCTNSNYERFHKFRGQRTRNRV